MANLKNPNKPTKELIVLARKLTEKEIMAYQRFSDAEENGDEDDDTENDDSRSSLRRSPSAEIITLSDSRPIHRAASLTSVRSCETICISDSEDSVDSDEERVAVAKLLDIKRARESKLKIEENNPNLTDSSTSEPYDIDQVLSGDRKEVHIESLQALYDIIEKLEEADGSDCCKSGSSDDTSPNSLCSPGEGSSPKRNLDFLECDNSISNEVETSCKDDMESLVCTNSTIDKSDNANALVSSDDSSHVKMPLTNIEGLNSPAIATSSVAAKPCNEISSQIIPSLTDSVETPNIVLSVNSKVGNTFHNSINCETIEKNSTMGLQNAENKDIYGHPRLRVRSVESLNGPDAKEDAIFQHSDLVSTDKICSEKLKISNEMESNLLISDSVSASEFPLTVNPKNVNCSDSNENPNTEFCPEQELDRNTREDDVSVVWESPSTTSDLSKEGRSCDVRKRRIKFTALRNQSSAPNIALHNHVKNLFNEIIQSRNFSGKDVPTDKTAPIKLFCNLQTAIKNAAPLVLDAYKEVKDESDPFSTLMHKTGLHVPRDFVIKLVELCQYAVSKEIGSQLIVPSNVPMGYHLDNSIKKQPEGPVQCAFSTNCEQKEFEDRMMVSDVSRNTSVTKESDQNHSVNPTSVNVASKNVNISEEALRERVVMDVLSMQSNPSHAGRYEGTQSEHSIEQLLKLPYPCKTNHVLEDQIQASRKLISTIKPPIEQSFQQASLNGEPQLLNDLKSIPEVPPSIVLHNRPTSHCGNPFEDASLQPGYANSMGATAFAQQQNRARRLSQSRFPLTQQVSPLSGQTFPVECQSQNNFADQMTSQTAVFSRVQFPQTSPSNSATFSLPLAPPRRASIASSSGQQTRPVTSHAQVLSPFASEPHWKSLNRQPSPHLTMGPQPFHEGNTNPALLRQLLKNGLQIDPVRPPFPPSSNQNTTEGVTIQSPNYPQIVVAPNQYIIQSAGVDTNSARNQAQMTMFSPQSYSSQNQMRGSHFPIESVKPAQVTQGMSFFQPPNSQQFSTPNLNNLPTYMYSVNQAQVSQRQQQPNSQIAHCDRPNSYQNYPMRSNVWHPFDQPNAVQRMPVHNPYQPSNNFSQFSAYGHSQRFPAPHHQYQGRYDSYDRAGMPHQLDQYQNEMQRMVSQQQAQWSHSPHPAVTNTQRATSQQAGPPQFTSRNNAPVEQTKQKRANSARGTRKPSRRQSFDIEALRQSYVECLQQSNVSLPNNAKVTGRVKSSETGVEKSASDLVAGKLSLGKDLPQNEPLSQVTQPTSQPSTPKAVDKKVSSAPIAFETGPCLTSTVQDPFLVPNIVSNKNSEVSKLTPPSRVESATNASAKISPSTLEPEKSAAESYGYHSLPVHVVTQSVPHPIPKNPLSSNQTSQTRAVNRFSTQPQKVQEKSHPMTNSQSPEFDTKNSLNILPKPKTFSTVENELYTSEFLKARRHSASDLLSTREQLNLPSLPGVTISRRAPADRGTSSCFDNPNMTSVSGHAKVPLKRNSTESTDVVSKKKKASEQTNTSQPMKSPCTDFLTEGHQLPAFASDSSGFCKQLNLPNLQDVTISRKEQTRKRPSLEIDNPRMSAPGQVLPPGKLNNESISAVGPLGCRTPTRPMLPRPVPKLNSPTEEQRQPVTSRTATAMSVRDRLQLLNGKRVPKEDKFKKSAHVMALKDKMERGHKIFKKTKD